MSKLLRVSAFLLVVAVCAAAHAGMIATYIPYGVDGGGIPLANYDPGWFIQQSPLPMDAAPNTSIPPNEPAKFAENSFTTNAIFGQAAGQTFTVPADRNYNWARAELCVGGDSGFTYEVTLHKIDPAVRNTVFGENGTALNILAANIGPNVLENGLSFVSVGQANPAILALDFSGPSLVSLDAGAMYMFRLTRTGVPPPEVSTQPNMLWYRDADPSDDPVIGALGANTGDGHPGGTVGDAYRKNAAGSPGDYTTIQGGSGRRDFSLAIYEVPEPATMVLMGLAVPALVLVRRKFSR